MNETSVGRKTPQAWLQSSAAAQLLIESIPLKGINMCNPFHWEIYHHLFNFLPKAEQGIIIPSVQLQP